MERPLCDRSAQPPDYPAAHLSRMGREIYFHETDNVGARQWAKPTQPQVGISRSGALKQSQVLGNRLPTSNIGSGPGAITGSQERKPNC